MSTVQCSETWPFGRPVGVVSRTYNLTQIDVNKWRAIVTTVYNGSVQTHRVVMIKFVNGHYLYNAGKVKSELMYVGRYEPRTDEIHWYKGGCLKQSSTNPVFVWSSIAMAPQSSQQIAVQKAKTIEKTPNIMDLETFPPLSLSPAVSNCSTICGDSTNSSSLSSNE